MLSLNRFLRKVSSFVPLGATVIKAGVAFQYADSDGTTATDKESRYAEPAVAFLISTVSVMRKKRPSISKR